MQSFCVDITLSNHTFITHLFKHLALPRKKRKTPSKFRAHRIVDYVYIHETIVTHLAINTTIYLSLPTLLFIHYSRHCLDLTIPFWLHKGPFTQHVKEILSVRNPNNLPVAFKVKTTAPKQYCVRPNSGRIDPGESVDVQGEKRREFFWMYC